MVQSAITHAPATWNVLGGLLIPTSDSNLKKKLTKEEQRATADQRFTMLELALKDHPYLTTDRLVVNSSAGTTIDSIKTRYQKMYDDPIHIISVLGADGVLKIQKTPTEPVVIVVNRDVEWDVHEWHQNLPWKEKAVLIEDTKSKCSSTQIREAAANETSVDFASPAVIKYINEKGLYKPKKEAQNSNAESAIRKAIEELNIPTRMFFV